MEAMVRQVVVDKLFGVAEGPEDVPSWLADLAQLAAGSGQLAACIYDRMSLVAHELSLKRQLAGS